MITLHSANGTIFAISGDLVERVEEQADTHITLIGGTSYVVKESLETIVSLFRQDRALIRALADRYLLSGDLPDPPWFVVDTQSGRRSLRVFEPSSDNSGDGSP